ncbi:hypothetical protein [Vibrio fluvialis]|uniref:hypothetical protein n=1 Tax=Vibrio fluvialis TaxID=676 RepID=UPI0015595FF3|nr:hypothetical protein [Vibrio fluvialis]
MSVYSISYDLNAPGKKYDELYNQIKDFNGWLHLLDSTWLVSTNLTADQVFQRLTPYLDNNDSVFVSKVNANQYAGWLTQEKWDWIRQHA